MYVYWIYYLCEEYQHKYTLLDSFPEMQPRVNCLVHHANFIIVQFVRTSLYSAVHPTKY